MQMPDTPAQAKARAKLTEAAYLLAAATLDLRKARAAADAAHDTYITALGAAMQAGIV